MWGGPSGGGLLRWVVEPWRQVRGHLGAGLRGGCCHPAPRIQVLCAGLGGGMRDAGGGGRGPGLRGELSSPLPLDELTLKLHLSLKQEQEKDERPKDTVRW